MTFLSSETPSLVDGVSAELFAPTAVQGCNGSRPPEKVHGPKKTFDGCARPQRFQLAAARPATRLCVATLCERGHWAAKRIRLSCWTGEGGVYSGPSERRPASAR